MGALGASRFYAFIGSIRLSLLRPHRLSRSACSGSHSAIAGRFSLTVRTGTQKLAFQLFFYTRCFCLFHFKGSVLASAPNPRRKRFLRLCRVLNGCNRFTPCIMVANLQKFFHRGIGVYPDMVPISLGRERYYCPSIGCHASACSGQHPPNVLWLLAVFARAIAGRFSLNHHVGVEVCAIYWAFVVVLWPLLYVLVYLI